MYKLYCHILNNCNKDIKRLQPKTEKLCRKIKKKKNKLLETEKVLRN